MNRARIRELCQAIQDSPGLVPAPTFVLDFVAEFAESPAAELPTDVAEWFEEREALLDRRGLALLALSPSTPTRETILAGDPLPAWYGDSAFETVAWSPWSPDLARALDRLDPYVKA